MELSTVTLCFLFVFSVAGEDNWVENTYKLHKELMSNRGYTYKANPQPEQNHTTHVMLDLLVRSISIDDKTQILTLNAWVLQYWKDHRLKWDPKDFGNLHETWLPFYYFWNPKLMVYNSAFPTQTFHYGYTPAVVYHTGMVQWVTPMTTKTECAMDLTYWPYDTQDCYIVMGSWTDHGFQVDFHPVDHRNSSTEKLMEHNIKTSHHWTVNHAKFTRKATLYDCCVEPYITVTVDITMTRTSPSFATTVILPAFAVALLVLVQFVLPVDYPPRVTVGVVATFMSAFMLMVFYYVLPPLGGSCPLIVKYYGLTLVMTVLSIALSGVLARLATEQLEVISFPPPAILKSILTGPLATVLCVRTMADKVGKGGGNMGNEDEILGESKGFQHEWLLLATAVDRLAAFTYVIIFSIALSVATGPLQ